MSEILVYRDGFEADGTIVKLGTLTSKGGNLMLGLQVPLDGKISQVVTDHLNNIAHITVRFSSHPTPAQPSDPSDRKQGTLALDGMGPAPGEEPGEFEESGESYSAEEGMVLTADNLEAWKEELHAKGKATWPEETEPLSEDRPDEEWLQDFEGQTTGQAIKSLLPIADEAPGVEEGHDDAPAPEETPAPPPEEGPPENEEH